MSQAAYRTIVRRSEITGGIPGYDLQVPKGALRVEFHFAGVMPANDGDGIWLRVSDDGGSTYKSGASDYSWNYAGRDSAGNAIAAQSSASTEIRLVADVGNASDEGAWGMVACIHPYWGATKTHFQWNMDWHDQAGLLHGVVGRGCYQTPVITDWLRIFDGVSSGFDATHAQFMQVIAL